MGVIYFVALVLLTLLFPPIGVAMVAGCGADLVINIILTLLGYFPGHIHAFYIIAVYYYRRDQRKKGVYLTDDAIGIFSSRVQSGGLINRERR